MRPELFTFPGTNFVVPGYSAMIVLAFLVGTWWQTRRASKVKCDPDVVLSLALIALVAGWVGGRLFYVIHYWDKYFSHQPMAILDLKAGGFEVYGGVIFAAFWCIVYLFVRRLPVRLYADLTAPTLLFAMGVGRLGCWFAGCCFGATCPDALPWAVEFPARSEAFIQHWQERRVTLPADLIVVAPDGQIAPVWTLAEPLLKQFPDGNVEAFETKLAEARKKVEKMPDSAARRKAATELSYAAALLDHFHEYGLTLKDAVGRAKDRALHSAKVHPAQIYSFVGPILLAWLLNAYFYRRTRHGSVFALAMILYGIERFIEEMVRSDNPVDTFGLTVSQGISVAVVAGGLLWWLILKAMPLRSSRPGIPVKKPVEPAAPGAQPA